MQKPFQIQNKTVKSNPNHKKTSFPSKNRIKTKTLHANHSTNKKKIIFLHEQSLKRATFTHFSNEDQIKKEPFLG